MVSKKLQKKHYEVTSWPKSFQTSYYENYLVHKKFPKKWLWKWWLPPAVIMKQPKTLVRKLWKLWSPRRVAVKLLPASVSCFWWKPTLRNLVHWTFFSRASHLVLGEDRQMMFVYLLRRQRSETTRFSWCFFFLSFYWCIKNSDQQQVRCVGAWTWIFESGIEF